MRRHGRLAVLLGLGLLTLPAGRAMATDAAQAPLPARPSVEVTALEGIVAPEGRASVTVHIANRGSQPLRDVRVRLSVHDRTRSRYALARAIDGGDVSPPRAALETDPSELAAASETALRLRAPAADLGLAGAEPGVYPATIGVLDESGVVEEFVTALVVPPEGGEPLRFSVFLTFEGPVAMRSGQPHAASAITASAERAQRLAREIGDGLAVTVAVDGRTVEELRDVASGESVPDDPILAEAAQQAIEALEEMASRPEVEIVAYPYGPADLVALIGAGMASEAQHLADRGRAVAGELTGDLAALPSLVIPPRGLDAATAGWLSGIAGGTLLTEEGLGLSLDRELPATPPAVRTLAGIAGLPVAVPDPLLADALERAPRSHSAALTAQRIIADSATTFFERPGASTPRGMLIAPPADRSRDVLSLLGGHVDEANWLEAVPLSTLLDEVPPDSRPETLAYGISQRSAELPASYLRSIDEAGQRLEPLAAVLGAEAVEGLERRLEAATSVAFRSDSLRAHGLAVATQLAEMAGQVQRAVSIVEGPLLTLTGREGTVPVTLANSSDHELHVRLRVLTTRYAVEDEGGRDLVLPPSGETTTTFEVRANAPGGTYPVNVEVSAPLGDMALATGQVSVRSTARSVAGLAVTGGAALFVLAWAAHGLIRRFGRGSRTLKAAQDDPLDEPETAGSGR